MAREILAMTEELSAYLRSVSVREPELLKRLREETASLPKSHMQISPEQGQFMGLLVRLGRVRRALEVGVYTGYSSLSVAAALPEDGRLVACDVSEEWTAVARRYWREAGVEGKIDLRLGPAIETLDGLIGEGLAGTFDFVFIDADKENYDGYYERALVLLAPGGLAAVDNVLWAGRVVDESVQDANTRAIRAFNRKLHADPRVWLSMVPVGDGVTLAVKRG